MVPEARSLRPSHQHGWGLVKGIFQVLGCWFLETLHKRRRERELSGGLLMRAAMPLMTAALSFLKGPFLNSHFSKAGSPTIVAGY